MGGWQFIFEQRLYMVLIVHNMKSLAENQDKMQVMLSLLTFFMGIYFS